MCVLTPGMGKASGFLWKAGDGRGWAEDADGVKDRYLMGTALLWQSSRMILPYSKNSYPVNTK